MNVNIDTELKSSFDADTGICAYLLERNGKSWRVEIPLADFEKHGTNIMGRRNLLESKFEAAMRADPNGQAKPDSAERAAPGVQ